MTPPPLITLLHNNLLRRRNPMTPAITPRTRPRTLTCMALLQLIPRLNTRTENLPLDTSAQTRRPRFTSFDARSSFGRAVACGSAVDGARGVFVGVEGFGLRDDHVVGPAFDAAGVVVHRVEGEVGAFGAGVGIAAVGGYWPSSRRLERVVVVVSLTGTARENEIMAIARRAEDWGIA